MAMNLRLDTEATVALQAEAERTGRSQQELVRVAVARMLNLTIPDTPPSDREQARWEQLVRPARVPYRRTTPGLRLPEGTTSLDLLDRSDRF
ncbi:hypothetical protein HPO96_14590 [Kribbella sandramycini]|uniref:Ribbon-helix-helix CopG family protein n=1 Tax=Kribbella sandramycini TaxID=60450 RepID=A0A7Y4L0U3_9ACTN|nr:hypothetical protein [Kribbella sandramycini]MBB6565203.1 hypothetical protein [Kribbella sandramycini]NOL41472.1 hypothetical protein [Kribbella sandramycini]